MSVKATRNRGRSTIRSSVNGPSNSTRASVSPVIAEHWTLRLYVAGQTPRSLTAFANLKRICEEHLAGRYQIELIDLVNNPDLARGDQIVALPTLVRRSPTPVKRIIGDLSNADRVLVGIDIRQPTPGMGQTTTA